MSANFSYEIQTPTERHVTIGLSGELTAERVSKLESDVFQLLADAMHHLHFLWDMRGVRRCDLGARGGLQKIQRAIGGKRYRTAFVASRPRIRGVALWVAHTSGDELARPFASQAKALDWLEHDVGRVEQIKRDSARLLARRGGEGRRA